jgi:plasmid maintenance system antidote protein VapI
MSHNRPIPSDLIDRINEVRLSSGFSVTELAHACSLDPTHLRAVLTDQRDLTPWVARRLMAALHIHEQIDESAPELID